MRRLLQARDFRSRIVRLILLLVAASGCVVGVAVLWNFHNLSQSGLENRTRIELQIISQNIATSLLFDDIATADEILSTFDADPAILEATLHASNGRVFTRYTRASPTPSHTTFNEISTDVVFSGETIGQLKATVSALEVFEQNTSSALFILAVLCLTFLGAAAAALPIIKSLLVPLLNLHDVAGNIAATKNYALRAQPESDDEVGQLGRMFNVMVEQVEKRDGMLEQQVKQRTAELEALAEEFKFRAFHDSLTGLPNRALLAERFDLSAEHAKRHNRLFACLLLDLDDFKTINDTKGHEVGDELLLEVAERLLTTVRGEDLVCRLGGDEFVILVNDLSRIEDADTIAQKVLTALNDEFFLEGGPINTAVSIGGAIYPTHGESLSAIKSHADVAMYKAKELGKNQFCLFSEGMQQDVRHRLMIQNDLRPGLESNQFEVYLQPKINPAARAMVGCEALIRWHHPVEGFLTPYRFIPYAEEIGMVAEIDYFVIRQCCAIVQHWLCELPHPVPVSFNLSGRHFHDHAIVKVLEAALADSGVNPQLLEAEITEAVLIQDPVKAQEIVRAIKALGLRISLDDFGTGYSSLNYLRTLPIDTVKLDRSFVAAIDTNDQDRRLTRGIVLLAQDLDLDLVAEGVETEAQLQALLQLGCVTMQGYHFLPPAPLQQLIEWHRATYPDMQPQNSPIA